MQRLSIDTLRGRQSVRVTFQLSSEVIELLRVMAVQLGIKQKTALIHLGLETLIARESSKRLAKLGGTEKDLQTIPRRRPADS